MSTDHSSTNTSTTQIGAFSGYNRRPQPATSGLTANFYGENGEDSDSIAALSLTKYQELDVFVNVFLVKDPSGKIMKDPVNGQYPSICSFTAKIQRPKPQRDGMLAQFFATNGADADQVNNLGLSRFLDALVYVEIFTQKPTATNPLPTIDAQTAQELDEVAKHLTAAERKQLEKRQKVFADANQVLTLSGFFQQPTVWTSLGSAHDFQDWLTESPCCFPSDTTCTSHPVILTSFEDGPFKDYYMLPFCQDHLLVHQQGQTPGGIAFLRMRHKMFIQLWATYRLRQILATPENFEMDPQKVMNFAIEKKLSQYIPATYLSKVLPH